MVDVHKLITNIEKSILVLIALFTVFGVGQEMYTVIETGGVKLTDLLLMFIYAEVLGMVAAFYKHHRIPISIPAEIIIAERSKFIPI